MHTNHFNMFLNILLFFLFLLPIHPLTIKSKLPLNLETLDKNLTLNISSQNIILDDTLPHDEIVIQHGTSSFSLKKEQDTMSHISSLITIFNINDNNNNNNKISITLPSSISSIIDNIKSKITQKDNEIENFNEDDNTKFIESELCEGNVSFCIFFFDFIPKDILTDLTTNISNFVNNNIKIFVSSDKQLSSKLNIYKFPKAYGYNSVEKVDYILKYKSFKQTISTILTPILKELNVDTLKLYDDTNLPKFFLFYDEFDNLNFNKKINLIKYEKVARKFRQKIKVGLLMYKRDKPTLTHFGINEKNLPAMVCVWNNKKYREVLLNNFKFEEYLFRFVKRKIKSWNMSEDEPSDNDSRSVKVITRNNYKKYFFIPSEEEEEERLEFDDDDEEEEEDLNLDEDNLNDKNLNEDKLNMNDKDNINLNEDKLNLNLNDINTIPTIHPSGLDILLTFSSPNCRFCVDLKPIINEIGNKIKINKIQNKVLVGNINATKNDFSGFDIKGYPTIILVTADSKVFYFNENNRSVEMLSKFVEENGYNKVDILTGRVGRKDDENINEENENDVEVREDL